MKITSNIELIYQNTFTSAKYRKQEIEKQKLFIVSEGYISVYEKTRNITDSLLEIHFEIGKKYDWNIIVEGEKSQGILSQKTFPKSFTPEIIRRKAQLILSYCENNGFPFATVKLDSISLIENKIKAKLVTQLNDLYYIDSIQVKGETKISRNFIVKTIDIKKGDTYNEKLIKQISSKINSVPFLENIKSPEVYFTKGKATLVLYIKDKPASKFNGILGLNSNKTTGKYELIGDASVDLRNIFNNGERLQFEWEKVKNNSQKYVVGFKLPYIFRSKIGTQFDLNYYRQDSSFANLDSKLGLNYRLNSRLELTIFGQNISSNSISNITSTASFPAINSINTTYYGLGLNYHKLDYEFNPRKGTDLTIEFSSGKKKITKNNTIVDSDYQNLNEKISQQKLRVNASWYLPLFNKTTVLFKLQSVNMFSNQLFENELTQIGGLKTLRGFNEQSILTSNFYALTLEYRYLFSRNSSVFAFIDYAYYENKSNNQFLHDTPFGFGLGVNFATKSGIFTLNYALGKEQNNPILIKNGKIHFGFVSLF